MASMQGHFLKALVVFRNYMYPELIRAVHVYKLENGVEKELEREYVFHSSGVYEEIGSYKVLTLEKFRPSAQFEGRVNGVWLCIYVFDDNRHQSPNLDDVPTLLSISSEDKPRIHTRNLKMINTRYIHNGNVECKRLELTWVPSNTLCHPRNPRFLAYTKLNPRLASVPTLANDLQIIFQLSHNLERRGETSVGVNSSGGLKRKHTSALDLNSVPNPESENEEGDEASGVLEKKKKRAATKDIARLALEDLTKYFDLPIVEASKNLKVGLTVLKKKCREFGIPRWPHRKIKSLDSLIRDLQAEVEQQQQQDDVAAMVVANRQRMLESEKESIERKPFMEIQWETKKFRQDIFKKRHRARAQNQFQTMPVS